MNSIYKFISEKGFNPISFAFLISWDIALLGLLIFFAVMYESGEDRSFQCQVKGEDKEYIQGLCYNNYKTKVTNGFPIYGFVSLAFILIVAVCIIYYNSVKSRIDKLELQRRDVESQEGNNSCFCGLFGCQERNCSFCSCGGLFCRYSIQLVLRFLITFALALVQLKWVYPVTFPSTYNCGINPSNTISENATKATYHCTTKQAANKTYVSLFFLVINGLSAFVILLELIYVAYKGCTDKYFRRDFKFFSTYLLNDHNTIDKYITDTKKVIREATKHYEPIFPNIAGEENGDVLGLEKIFTSLIVYPKRENCDHDFSGESKQIIERYIKRKENPYSSVSGLQDILKSKEGSLQVPSKISLIGRPGIGKSLLCQKICFDMASKEKNQEGSFDFVYLFNKRCFKKNEKLNLRKLFHKSQFSGDLSEAVYRYILDHPEKVLLIFDGLRDVGKKEETASCWHRPVQYIKKKCRDVEEMSISAIFHKLINGTFLNGATIITTSRPTALPMADDECFDKTLEIVGFTEDEIKQYVKRVSQEDSEMEQRIWGHIRRNSNLLSLCYVPAICHLVCFSLQQILKKSKDAELNYGLPLTLPKIYTLAMTYILKEQNRNSETQAVVPKSSTSIPDQQNIQPGSSTSIPDQQNIQPGSSTSIPDQQNIQPGSSTSIPGQQNTQPGSSTSIPDQLEMGHVSQSSSTSIPDQQNTQPRSSTSIPDKQNSVNEALVKDLGKLAYDGLDSGTFFFKSNEAKKYKESGLLHQLPEAKTQFCFLHLTMQEFVAAAHIVQTKKEEDLKVWISKHIREGKWQLVIQFVAGFLHEKSEEWRKIFTKLMPIVLPKHSNESRWPSREDKKMVLVLFHCIFENAAVLTNNDPVSVDLSGSEITDADTCAIVHVLQHFHEMHSLDVSCNLIGRLGYLKIFKLLNMANLCTLVITKNQAMSKETAKYCSKALSSDQCKLTTLNVSGNKIEDDGLKHLSDALSKNECKLTTLDISGNKIEDDGLKHLSDALSKDECKLTTLDISGNKIGDDGLKYLSDALSKDECKLTTLDISGNKIGDDGLKYLSDALSKDECKLTTLDISGNKIGDDRLKYLSDALSKDECKLTKLNISGNKIGDDGVEQLSKALSSKECQLTTLNVSGNEIGDDGVEQLSKALSSKECQLSTLNVSGNKIGDDGVEQLSKALSSNQCHLTTLNVSGNKIGDDGVEQLSKALSSKENRLTTLDMSYNEIGDDGLKHLSDALPSNKCKLTTLNCLGNPISDDDVKYFYSKNRESNGKITNAKLPNLHA